MVQIHTGQPKDLETARYYWYILNMETNESNQKPTVSPFRIFSLMNSSDWLYVIIWILIIFVAVIILDFVEDLINGFFIVFLGNVIIVIGLRTRLQKRLGNKL